MKRKSTLDTLHEKLSSSHAKQARGQLLKPPCQIKAGFLPLCTCKVFQAALNFSGRQSGFCSALQHKALPVLSGLSLG